MTMAEQIDLYGVTVGEDKDNKHSNSMHTCCPTWINKRIDIALLAVVRAITSTEKLQARYCGDTFTGDDDKTAEYDFQLASNSAVIDMQDMLRETANVYKVFNTASGVNTIPDQARMTDSIGEAMLNCNCNVCSTARSRWDSVPQESGTVRDITVGAISDLMKDRMENLVFRMDQMVPTVIKIYDGTDDMQPNFAKTKQYTDHFRSLILHPKPLNTGSAYSEPMETPAANSLPHHTGMLRTLSSAYSTEKHKRLDQGWVSDTDDSEV
jgi:hypothetical protein